MPGWLFFALSQLERVLLIFFHLMQDLVGNHLIIAVREELGVVSSELSRLKERLEQLEFENGALRSENIALRSAAGADLQTRSQQPSRRK